ncbi:hypothetical protein RUM43_011428 [Polyplax serrata]|uniref:Uncharacterized protein n=1 Tax=Polyplax serrata TaxID=468196 RepID=A0AAN8S123_POLSC
MQKYTHDIDTERVLDEIQFLLLKAKKKGFLFTGGWLVTSEFPSINLTRKRHHKADSLLARLVAVTDDPSSGRYRQEFSCQIPKVRKEENLKKNRERKKMLKEQKTKINKSANLN